MQIDPKTTTNYKETILNPQKTHFTETFPPLFKKEFGRPQI
jgi:hypothetical protein